MVMMGQAEYRGGMLKHALRRARRQAMQTPILLGVLFFGACCGHRPPQQIGYWGETLPMREVVDRVNQNNLSIPSLYARHSMEADLFDPGRKKSFFVNTSGNLLMRKPRDLLLRGKHDLAG